MKKQEQCTANRYTPWVPLGALLDRASGVFLEDQLGLPVEPQQSVQTFMRWAVWAQAQFRVSGAGEILLRIPQREGNEN